ncbi:MAG TPA: hypothetical protein VGS01_11430 [Candidatus Limnocylindria bacterium]|nr:hypothetical protein [Candidatus Limnocylindria bacterium]
MKESEIRRRLDNPERLRHRLFITVKASMPGASGGAVAAEYERQLNEIRIEDWKTQACQAAWGVPLDRRVPVH